MSAWRWLIARKWGQILAFAGGGFAAFRILVNSSIPNASVDPRDFELAGLLLVVGLVFKALAIWRERRS